MLYETSTCESCDRTLQVKISDVSFCTTKEQKLKELLDFHIIKFVLQWNYIDEKSCPTFSCQAKLCTYTKPYTNNNRYYITYKKLEYPSEEKEIQILTDQACPVI